LTREEQLKFDKMHPNVQYRQLDERGKRYPPLEIILVIKYFKVMNNYALLLIHGKSSKARAVIENSKYGVLLGLSNDVWGLPGGAIEKDESSKDAILREVREETGLQEKEIIKITFLGVNKLLHSDIYCLRIKDDACESVIHFVDSDEFSELKWFAPTTLPGNTYPDVIEHIDWFLKQ
jgi:8-oxo-dGTP pyrophosphatase MutT (NUDIX family)